MNADRIKINNTDRPWIYASGYRGAKKMFVDLKSYDPHNATVSRSTDKSPKIDGLLTEPCWDESFRLTLPKNNGVLYLRHDEKNLYAGAVFHKDAENDGSVSWVRNQKEKDSSVWKDDCLELFFSNKRAKDLTDTKRIHIAVSASGARYDGLITRMNKTKLLRSINWDNAVKKEDATWDAEWKSSVSIKDEKLSVELAIPWETFEKIGAGKDSLFINTRNRLPMPHQFYRPMMFAQSLILIDGKKSESKKRYTVRLHFSEPDDVRPGQRVFDVKLQGKPVLVNFDIIKETGKKHTALIKEFKNIEAADTVTLELITKVSDADAMSVPVISGMEVITEK